MIKGRVVDIDTKVPLPNANVLITNTGKAITCDNNGAFTMYVSMKDSLRFSSLGYLSKVIHVRDIDSAKYYILQVELIHDFIKLREVTIYPFSDLDQFRKAFMGNKDPNTVSAPGLRAPHYKGVYRPKFYNPISMLYDRIKNRSSANPNFNP